MNISFRNAKPEDVSAAIPLIYSTGPAAFEYVFKSSEKKTASDFLKYAFVRPGSEFSFTNHICITGEDGAVLGIGAPFSSDVTLSFTLYAIKYIMSFYGPIKGAGVCLRGLNIEKIIPPPKGNTMVLAHLGVRPELQSKGLGTQMINHMIDEARQKGKSSVSLDVSVENPKAIALYKSLGFEIVKEHVSNLESKYARVVNHYKMFREI